MATLNPLAPVSFENAFKKLILNLPPKYSAIALKDRQQAFTQIQQLDLPHVRSHSQAEDWKYSNLSRYNFDIFNPVQTSVKDLASISVQASWKIDPHTPFQWIFYNGLVLEKPLTTPFKNHNIDSNTISSLSNSAIIQNKIQALNNAFYYDGASIVIPKNCIIENPIYLIHIIDADQEPLMAHPRNTIIAEENSQISIVEVVISIGTESSFSNLHTEIKLAEGAYVNHLFLQHSKSKSLQIANIQVQQAAKSHYIGNAIQAGGELNRVSFNIELLENFAKCGLYGLEIATLQQQMDLLFNIQHLAPNTVSKTISRAIIKDKAKSAFTGKIWVPQYALNTKACLDNKNLLLSPHAEANTRPQLFIDTNEVECSHGATVGNLDAEALFFLQSRGLCKEAAKQLLIQSFISPSLQGLPPCTLELIQGVIDEY